MRKHLHKTKQGLLYSNCCDLFLCQISKIKALLALKIPLMGIEMHKFILAPVKCACTHWEKSKEKSAKSFSSRTDSNIIGEVWKSSKFGFGAMNLGLSEFDVRPV